MAGTERTASGIRERVDVLERERDVQRSRLARQEQSTARLRLLVEDVRRGVPPREGSRQGVLVVVVVLAVVAHGLYSSLESRRSDGGATQLVVPALRETMTPHLLVTSTPDRARVRIDGKPAGVAPVVLALPPVVGTHEVLVEAPGHHVFSRQVQVTGEAGRHVHAELRSSSELEDHGSSRGEAFETEAGQGRARPRRAP